MSLTSQKGLAGAVGVTVDTVASVDVDTVRFLNFWYSASTFAFILSNWLTLYSPSFLGALTLLS